MVNINLPHEFEEFAPNEIKDFILGLIKQEYRRYQDNAYICRHREICEAILNNNSVDGTMSQIREEVLETIRTTPPQKINLSKYGFTIEHNKHFKLKWHNKPYGVIIPMTASDHRWIRNLLADVDKKFF